MEERTIKIYVAFDETEHETADACLKHEKENSWRRAIGLTEEQVADALSGDGDEDISEALKTIGYRIAGIGKAKAKAPKEKPYNPAEPDLPAPVGREPPEPPMTAEQAMNHTRA